MTYQYRGKDTIAQEEAEQRAAEGWRNRQGKRRVPEALCGTLAGKRAHNRRNEPLCEPCRLIQNQYLQELRGGNSTGRKNNPVPVHGTLSGYRRHERDKQPPCFQCKVAFAAYMSGYRARKRKERMEKVA